MAGINRSDALEGVVGGSSPRGASVLAAEAPAAPSVLALDACELLARKGSGLLTPKAVGRVPPPAIARGEGIGRHRGDSGGSAWVTLSLQDAGAGCRFASTCSSTTARAPASTGRAGVENARKLGADEEGTPDGSGAVSPSAEDWAD